MVVMSGVLPQTVPPTTNARTAHALSPARIRVLRVPRNVPVILLIKPA